MVLEGERARVAVVGRVLERRQAVDLALEKHRVDAAVRLLHGQLAQALVGRPLGL